jgi:RHS repeat-associated protein
MKLGNTLTEQWTYNAMLQPTQIVLGTTPGSGSVRGLQLTYPAPGNNGNLMTQTISGSGLSANAVQSYQYDRLNRIHSTCEGASCTSAQGIWGRGFDYDWYGNGWVSSWTAIPPSTVTPVTPSAYDASTNRMAAMAPDEEGNQKAVAGNSFSYDAESRMSRSVVNVLAVYQYDGEGRRVMKVDCALGAVTCDSATQGAASTWFVYDAQGQLAAEYTNGAVAAPPCTTCYVMTDHLGSTRVVTDGSTGAALQCHDYLPFGEEIPAPVGGRTGCYAGTQATGLLFTGKERDSETQTSATPSGLDYFEARYFSGAQGRFTSPDSPLVDQNPYDPQSWNLYSYARGNPFRVSAPNPARRNKSSSSLPNRTPAASPRA